MFSSGGGDSREDTDFSSKLGRLSVGQDDRLDPSKMRQTVARLQRNIVETGSAADPDPEPEDPSPSSQADASPSSRPPSISTPPSREILDTEAVSRYKNILGKIKGRIQRGQISRPARIRDSGQASPLAPPPPSDGTTDDLDPAKLSNALRRLHAKFQDNRAAKRAAKAAAAGPPDPNAPPLPKKRRKGHLRKKIVVSFTADEVVDLFWENVDRSSVCLDELQDLRELLQEEADREDGD